jgi:uncharacterized protein
MIYADSSALVRIYLDEPKSPEIRAFVKNHTDIACADLTYVEVRAALASAFRRGRITESTLIGFKAGFESWWDKLIHVAIDPVLLKRAGDLAEYGKLHGYDAMHLAAAERLKLGGIHNLQFLCFDQELVRAAKMLGIACADL